MTAKRTNWMHRLLHGTKARLLTLQGRFFVIVLFIALCVMALSLSLLYHTSAATIEQITTRYLSEYISYADQSFSEEMNAAKMASLAMLVIFLSDHGDFGGEYSLIRKGADLPEVLTHIPMIWRGPEVQPVGRRDDVFVNITDLFPTLCDLLHVETPFGVQGRSMLPLLRGEPVPAHEFDTAYSESGFSGLYWDNDDALTLQDEGATMNMVTFDCLNTWTQCGQVRMVRHGDYKLQMDMMGQGYLYDLKADPYELRNRWNDPALQAIQIDLLTRMTAQILQKDDLLPAPHRRYRVKVHPKGYWYQAYHAKDDGVKQMEPLSHYVHTRPEKS